MIVILNEDPVYVSWLRRHRGGFVLDTRRNATRRNTTLHRATCEQIRKMKTRTTHWTTGGRVKACSQIRDELIDWAQEQIGRAPRLCALCEPMRDELPLASPTFQETSDQPLTKLEKEIVSAVVESAVIHLDNELEHRMTVAELAQYLSKTPGQISSALLRLVAGEMLEFGEGVEISDPLSPTVRVYPTATALCTLPAFACMAPERVQHELAKLRGTSG